MLFLCPIDGDRCEEFKFYILAFFLYIYKWLFESSVGRNIYQRTTITIEIIETLFFLHLYIYILWQSRLGVWTWMSGDSWWWLWWLVEIGGDWWWCSSLESSEWWCWIYKMGPLRHHRIHLSLSLFIVQVRSLGSQLDSVLDSEFISLSLYLIIVQWFIVSVLFIYLFMFLFWLFYLVL